MRAERMGRRLLGFVVFLFFAAEFSVLAIAVSSAGHQGPHISSLNLLLPPRTTRPVRYRLLGFNGCFTWSWDHHDVLSVEPDYNATVKHCATSAVLTSIAPYSSRRATAVHATDVFTGQVLRCEVFIDKISRIRIFHHSLKLDLDGMATLRIRAFDSEENVFSSLVGLQFMWQLSPVNPSGDFVAHRLVHVPLKDTALEDGEIDTQIELEQSGVGSDLYVVQGIGAGQERVTTQLLEPLFEDVIDVVVLTVAEAVSLDPPSPIYIIPGTHLQYTLKTLRRNIATVMTLPSPHHRWFIANSSVAEIDEAMGAVVGRTHGVTTVVVEDTRVEGHQQTSTLHVVTPVSLRLYLTPFTLGGSGPSSLIQEPPVMSSDIPWQLVVGRKYVVQVFTFSRESGTRPLQLTKDNDLRRFYTNQNVWVIEDIAESVAAKQGWHNCSLLHAIKEGSGTLVATLAHGSMVQDVVTGKWLHARKEVLREEQKVFVCTPVRIIMPPVHDSGAVLLLPWIPGHGQQCQLFVEGGCGERAADYWWSSSNPELASVNSLGVVKANGLGKAVIHVTSIRDPLNNDEIIVDISMPAFIDVFPGLSVEVEIPGSLPVAVTLLNAGGKQYSQCDSFSPLVQWDIVGGEELLVQTDKSSEILPLLDREEASPCAWSLIVATKAGRATVSALLDLRDSISESKSFGSPQRFLETSWAVAAYVPLWVEQVGDGNSYGGYSFKSSDIEATPEGSRFPREGLRELLLAIKSSMRVIVQGGPERWRQGVEFVESILDEGGTIAASSQVAVTHLNEGAGRLWLVTCMALGNHKLVFHRGNLVGTDHPARAVASVSLTVICALPSSITLLIDEPENNLPVIKSASQADRDANHLRTTHYTVINRRTIRVSAVALAPGMVFANGSSLYLEWALNECKGLAEWDSAAESDWMHGESTWERFLLLSDGSGECIVEATVGGLVSSKLVDHDTHFSVVEKLAIATPSLRDAAPLQLVSALRLEPRKLLLFLHPDAKGNIVVLGGTSDVETHIQDPRIVALSHQPPTVGLLQLLVGAKGLGSTMVTVRDVGLATPSEASATVLVADVSWVKMLIPEDASLLLGSNMTIQLEAGDEAGHIFDPTQFFFMNVKVHAHDDIVDVIKTPKSAPDEVSPNTFMIRGASVGLTSTLHVSVQRHTGQEILSDFGRVAVFAPLSIHPPSLVIAPGGQFVLSARGGPRVGASVEFSSSNSEVACIDRITGRLKALSPGNVTIFAQARSPGGLIITEDSIKVRVQLHFTPILNVRGGQLAVGREMSIFPTATEEDLLSFIELCTGYTWSVTDEQVLVLRDAKAFSSSNGETHQVKGHSSIADRKRVQSSNFHAQESSVGMDEGFSVRVFGRSAGRTTVTVSFTCHFGSGEYRTEPQLFTTSDSIWVVPDPPLALGMPATWLLRPQYTSSVVLRQWMGQFPSQTDTGSAEKSVLYTVLHEGNADQGVISVSKDGKIRTTERLELACIRAWDRNTGRAEVAACIRVAEVAQVMVGGDDFPYHVAELSVGSSQNYVVTLGDEFGTPFLETGRGASLLVLETNRADIVTMKVSDCEHLEKTCNLSITVQALRQGTALVRISFKGLQHVVDFILIKVGAFVNPRNPSLHIGGRVNFTIIGKGLHVAGERGHWTSDNPKVLQIDGHIGLAKAVGEGTAIVSFTGSHLTTYTTVTVIRVASVTIDAPVKIGQISNVGHEEGYRFPVKFIDAQGSDVGILDDNHEVSYECRLEPSFLGLAVPWREPSFSTFYCVFFAFGPLDIYHLEENQRIVTSSGCSNGSVHLSISAIVPGDPPITGSGGTTFVGGFEIVNTPEQFHLSPSTNRSLITIVGNTGQIHLSWGRTDVMVVKKISETNAACGVADQVVYEVKLTTENQPFTDKVVFSLHSTGQQEERIVNYNPEIQTTSLLAKPVLTAVALVVALLVLPLVFCARLLDLPQPAPEALLDGTESLSDGALFSPGEQTPPPTRSNYSHTSPPQPYTDYISRTIEKTPYYRREGIRRFDPSRTY